MGLRQRLIGLIYVIMSFCNILTTVGMATLIISIASDRPLVVYRSKEDFRLLVQLVSAAVISEWLDDCVVGLVTGYRIAISEGHVNYWIAPCTSSPCLRQPSKCHSLNNLYADHAAGLFRAFAPSWLQSERFEFTASGSSSSEDRSKLNDTQSGSAGRMWSTVRSANLSFHSTYILLLGLALTRNLLNRPPFAPTSSTSEDLLTYSLWPPILWLVLINAFTVPIRCAFNPPSIPNRA